MRVLTLPVMVQYGYYDEYAGDEVGQEDQHVLRGGIENEDVNYGQDEPRYRGEHCCFVAVFLAVCPPTLAGIFSRQECVVRHECQPNVVVRYSDHT